MRLSMERIEKLIQKLRDHSYQPNPARRVYIAKKNSSKKYNSSVMKMYKKYRSVKGDFGAD